MSAQFAAEKRTGQLSLVETRYDMMTVDQANEADLKGDFTKPTADLTGCRDGFTERAGNDPTPLENSPTRYAVIPMP
jgi:hypothetical protein